MYREFKSITEYRIADLNCTGEPNVEIIYVDGPNESFELASFSCSSKGIDLRATNNCNGALDKMTSGLQEKVTKISCELNDVNVKIQKQLHEYQTHCQTIDQNVGLLSNSEIEYIYSGEFIFRRAITSAFYRDMVISGSEISTIMF